VQVEDRARVGFPTPSRKLEFYSATLKEWGWPEYAIPGYIKSHVHRDNIDINKGEMLLLPTFRLPTLIHSRSGNAKWLYEISHKNPVWLHASDAARMGISTGDLVRITSSIGYFVDRVWVTEGIRPGIVACSHHLGRWRLQEDSGGERWSTAVVKLEQIKPGEWMMRQVHGVRPFASDDPDSARIHWEDAGVHQNLVFPVQPDPVSGQHCWHQKVTVTRAAEGDRYGDIFVDTNQAHLEYQRWLKLARPVPAGGKLRRPLWLPRPYRPDTEAFHIDEEE
jgi:anaerobic selenocysteine-containing dehydrogenase